MMKSLSIRVILLTMLLAGVSSCNHYVNVPVNTQEVEVVPKESWQSRLENTTLVSSLAIPGTHDTGAYVSGGPLAITQYLSIKEQLSEGVRAFDVRLRAVGNKKLVVYHGFISQGLTFKKDVLSACVDFLKENPREFIIMSLKKERQANGYEELLRKAITESPYKDYFVTDFRNNISVGELRGKILLLHRSNIGAPFLGGIFSGWRDNATFEARIVGNSSVANLFVEDEYKVPSLFHIDNKWNAIKKNLENSNSDKNLTNWYITFSSGTSLFAYPRTVSRRINPRILDLFSNRGAKKYRGIIFMDHVEKNDMVTKSIINSNFE